MLLGSDGRDFFEDGVDRSHGHDQRGLGKIDCLIYDGIDKLINYNSSCWQNGFHALMLTSQLPTKWIFSFDCFVSH